MRAPRLLLAALLPVLLWAAGGDVRSQLRAAPPLPEHELARPPTKQAPLPPRAELTPRPPAPDPHYDRTNPDYRVLQPSSEGMRGLPRDTRERVDWVRALRGGAITPRAELERSGQPQVLDLDVIMKNTREMPHVRFPHKAHTEWLSCSNCHDSIFLPKAGANPVTMDSIFRGQYCGVCHGRVAFVTRDTCERCHNVVQANGKRWW